MRLALFLKVMSLESGPNTKIRSWRGDAMAGDAAGLRSHGTSEGCGPVARESCARTLPAASRNASSTAPSPGFPSPGAHFLSSSHRGPRPSPTSTPTTRPRGRRARPGRAESRHDEVTMSTGHEAVKTDTDRHRKAAAAHLPTCLQRRPCRRIMKHGQP